MKIFQKHTIQYINGVLYHSIEYKLGKDKDDALTEYGYKDAGYPYNISIDECPEVYALEVSKKTIEDEISHCKDLITEWTKHPNYPKVDNIIARQQNLIKLYKKLLVKAGK